MATYPKPYSDTADRIIQARTAAGLETADAAALRLGVSSRSYRNHEVGRHTPKPDAMRRYAEAFGVPYAWLSTGLGQGPTSV